MRTVLVTGATRGAGRAIAMALAASGWEVVALGRDRHILEQMRADRGIVPLAIDLTERDELRAIIEDLKVDALVHAALRWPEPARFSSLREADIDMCLEVNLSAMLQLTNAVIRVMAAEGRGSILMVTPDPEDGLLPRTIEGATRAFVEALEAEVSEAGVAVACVRIGQAPFEDMARDVVETLAAGLEHTPTGVSPESGAHRQTVRTRS